MPARIESLAAAFFEKKQDAANAIVALRQAGLAQIGVAAHDDSAERKLADHTADYARIADVHNTLVAAGMSEHQANYFRERLEHNGVLVIAAAPAGQWSTAQRTLENSGGEVAVEIPPRAEHNIPSPAQQGTVENRPEPGAPQSAVEPTSGMGSIELRGTLRDAYRRQSGSEHKAA